MTDYLFPLPIGIGYFDYFEALLILLNDPTLAAGSSVIGFIVSEPMEPTPLHGTSVSLGRGLLGRSEGLRRPIWQRK